MSKFESALDAVKYLGQLIRVPRHGVVVLHAVKRGGLLEAPEGFNARLVDCEGVGALVEGFSVLSGPHVVSEPIQVVDVEDIPDVTDESEEEYVLTDMEIPKNPSPSVESVETAVPDAAADENEALPSEKSAEPSGVVETDSFENL